MTRKPARRLIALGILGLALGGLGIWTVWGPVQEHSHEARAQRPALELVAPAFGQTNGNGLLVAHAGFDRTVAVGDTVQLDGSDSSVVEGESLDYLWEFLAVPAGSLAELTDPAAVKPSFVADLPGDYVVQLTITEGVQVSAPDTVTISTVNSAPAADA